MEDCIFCKIIKGEIPSIKIFEDDKVFVFADINPILDGHTLIIPKNHAENIWEIEADDLAAIHQASQKVAAAIKEALNPDGVALFQLNGRGVNQVVMHYHLHLVPHIKGGPDLPITSWEMIPGDMEAIQKTADKIAGCFA